MSRPGALSLPNELLLDIFDLLAPPCWEWGEDNKAQASFFLNLRLVCKRFDDVIIHWLLTNLRRNVPSDTDLNLMSSPNVKSAFEMGTRFLRDLVEDCHTRGVDSSLVVAIRRAAQEAVTLLLPEGHDADRDTLRKTYTRGLISCALSCMTVSGVIQNLADVNAVESAGNTTENRLAALVAASSVGNIPDIKSLIDVGIDINSDHELFGMPTHAAAFGGHLDVIKYLHEEGADVKKKGSDGRTALHYAALAGQDSAARLLLDELELDANTKNTAGDTPLICAAATGQVNVTRLLLANQDVDPNPKDKDGCSALLLAACKGYDAIVELLLERDDVEADCREADANIGALGMTAFHGDGSIARMLIRRPEIDCNAVDGNGDPPLKLAALRGHENIVRLLLGVPGINVNALDSLQASPMMWAAHMGHLEALELFLERDDVDMNLTTDGGLNAMKMATVSGRTAAVRALLSHRATDVNSRSERDEHLLAPLGFAAAANRPEVMAVLLEHPDIDPNIQDIRRQTPLVIAAKRGCEETVEMLLGVNIIDVNMPDVEGFTPLIHAAAENHEAVVKLLLDHPDIDVHWANDWDDTALMHAAANGNETMVKMLSEHDNETTDAELAAALEMASEHGQDNTTVLLSSLMQKTGYRLFEGV